MDNHLRRFYSYEGEFFLLVRQDGIIIVEDPTVRGPDEGPPETLLRIFMSQRDAQLYLDGMANGPTRAETRVLKISLVGLWSLLPRINSLAEKHYQAPVRIEVTAINNNQLVSVDTLHSNYALLS